MSSLAAHAEDSSTFGGLNPPKSNLSFSDIKLHNISLWWHNTLNPGIGLTIGGVHGISVSDVVGTLVPTAGTLVLATDVHFSNITIGLGGGKHGFRCGANVSDVTATSTSPPCVFASISAVPLCLKFSTSNPD